MQFLSSHEYAKCTFKQLDGEGRLKGNCNSNGDIFENGTRGDATRRDQNYGTAANYVFIVGKCHGRRGFDRGANKSLAGYVDKWYFDLQISVTSTPLFSIVRTVKIMKIVAQGKISRVICPVVRQIRLPAIYISSDYIWKPGLFNSAIKFIVVHWQLNDRSSLQKYNDWNSFDFVTIIYGRRFPLEYNSSERIKFVRFSNFCASDFTPVHLWLFISPRLIWDLSSQEKINARQARLICAKLEIELR